MSDSSRRKRQNASNGTGNSGNGQQSGANASSSVRDFVFLDEAKIFSYLSQIEGGLRLLRDSVESQLDTEQLQTGGDKTAGQTSGEGGFSPAAAALGGVVGALLGGPAIPLGLMAGANGKVAYQRSWEKSTDNLTDSSAQFAGSRDLSILHHAAFDLVVKELGDRLLEIKGALTVLPISAIVTSLHNASKIGLSLNDPTAIDSLAGAAAYGEMGLQSVVFLENDTKQVHAYVHDSSFTMPPALINGTYGACSSVRFTLIGLEAQDVGKARRHIPRQVQTKGKVFFEAMGQLFKGFEDSMGIDSGKRVVPLAIYRDL